jgi:hypothetical protein
VRRWLCWAVASDAAGRFSGWRRADSLAWCRPSGLTVGTPQRPVRVGVGQLWLDDMGTLLWSLAAATVTWWPRARRVLDVLLGVILSAYVLLVAGPYAPEAAAPAPREPRLVGQRGARRR